MRADFEAYVDGFSPNVEEVLAKFRFRNQLPTLVEADALGFLLEKFLVSSINLSPLDNHGMGTVFEELIRRFNEENNEEAGEHFTPRDVVQLMARLVFLPAANGVRSGTYLVYDGACGTGGMLTVAEETLTQLAGEQGKDVSIHLYGQEVNPETYAISKADLILKGEGVEADNMQFGSTLLVDRVAEVSGAEHHLDFNRFMAAVETDVSEHRVKLTAKRYKLLQTALAVRDEAAEPVIKKTHKSGTEPNPLQGLFSAAVDGKPAVVEYEPDTDLRDTEQIPLTEEGGIDAFLRREVLPYAPDAWYVPDSVKVGYEISFTRHFYKPQPMRPLDEIRADILALDRETEGWLAEVLAAGRPTDVRSLPAQRATHSDRRSQCLKPRSSSK